jgi:uncharacterized membrane protein YuzA (DUF378 family)
MNLSLLKTVAFIFLLIGGVNSGFIGLFNVNILSMFGILYRIMELLIGVSAGYLIYTRYYKKEVS